MKLMVHATLVIHVQAAEVTITPDGKFHIDRIQVAPVQDHRFVLEGLEAGSERAKPEIHDEVVACVYAQVLDSVSEQADNRAAALSPEFAEKMFTRRASDEEAQVDQLEKELRQLEEDEPEVAAASENLANITKLRH